ncbi:MAG: DUF2161 family putative PD-(D/E)XK-type phosphodiesterase [Janthinobacterium lividum]
MREASLYPAVKRFLESQGYEVKGEVAGCDVVGIRADTNDVVGTKPGAPARLVIAEMKLAFNLELLLQAVERMGAADEIWLAVTATRRGRDRDSRARKLCRLLGFGLIAIHPHHHVEILAEPAPYQPRRDTKARRKIVAEHAARQGDPSPGGTGGVPVMTAYRQEALRCAARLQPGPLRPRDLRADAPRAAAILHRNVYGWFARVTRGVYALTANGEAALRHWSLPGPVVAVDGPPSPSPDEPGGR